MRIETLGAMMINDPAWFGILAVLGASVLIVLRPLTFFRRKLLYEEAFSVCWVAWSIYMGVFVVSIGLRPLGLSRDAQIAAVGVAVCISLIAIFCLARVPTDWKSAATKSFFGLFILTLVVVPLTAALARISHAV